jgi:hypothetical protein
MNTKFIYDLTLLFFTLSFLISVVFQIFGSKILKYLKLYKISKYKTLKIWGIGDFFYASGYSMIGYVLNKNDEKNKTLSALKQNTRKVVYLLLLTTILALIFWAISIFLLASTYSK